VRPCGASPGAFNDRHPFCTALQAIGLVRQQQAALRYGRYYFRPISGDGAAFDLCRYPTGIIAYSRILNDQEVLVIANTDPTMPFSGFVVVDLSINNGNPSYQVIYSNLPAAAPTSTSVILRSAGSVTIQEVDGSQTDGPVRILPVTLQPNEIQILAVPS
jgi:hypothetical protein